MKNNKKQFHTYEEVCDYIAHQHSVVYSLDHFKKFMEDFGNPQNKLKVIHIAGTNGKGSTTCFVASVLFQMGYKVATFTSPALVSRLDVIRINNEPIKEETIVGYANEYLDLCVQYHLSQFEIEVFFSVLYFISQDVDFCIYEVGLGGRLDATNIVSPVMTAITNIGLDHTDYLGNTHAEIAREKAGIIKEGIPLITGSKREDVLDVFKEIAKEKHTDVDGVSTPSNIKVTDEVSFDYKGYHIKLNTLAKYQVNNAILAIEIVNHLNDKGYTAVNDEALLKGLYQMYWPARFEAVRKHPLMILDGAHNKEGMDALVESARDFKNIKVLFSALKDKDTHHMIEDLLTLTDDITITEFKHVRFGSAVALNEGFNLTVEPDYKKWLKDHLNDDATLIITGSLYFISELRPYLLKLLKNNHS